MQVESEDFEGDTAGDESKGRADPREERALVCEREPRIRLLSVTEHRRRKAPVVAHDATVRNPAFPIDESGVFCERAELRYRLQYEI